MNNSEQIRRDAPVNKATEAVKAGTEKVANLGAQAVENTRKVMQTGVEATSNSWQHATDHLTRTMGFSGDDSERLAHHSKQNIDAVMHCGTIMNQSVRDTSRSWFELSQKQWQRNLEGMKRLMSSKSIQEFTTVQSDLVREGLQTMMQDSRSIAEKSLRAIDEANKSFATTPSPAH